MQDDIELRLKSRSDTLSDASVRRFERFIALATETDRGTPDGLGSRQVR